MQAGVTTPDRGRVQTKVGLRRGMVIGVRWLLLGAAIVGLVRSVWAGDEAPWPTTQMPAVVRGR
jgi:predicted DNA repair protein MutK